MRGLFNPPTPFLSNRYAAQTELGRIRCLFSSFIAHPSTFTRKLRFLPLRRLTSALSLHSAPGRFGLLPDKFQEDGYNSSMSASEILKELPKLTEAERRTIREGLLEIANQDPDVALCNQAALDGALVLDRMEAEDAQRQSG